MSWDPRAERIAAKAQAEQSRAQAEAVRTQTEIERQRAQAELDRDRQERRRTRAKERRASRVAALRRNGGLLLPVVAVGAPAVIAWNGQYEFGADQMKLGALAPLLPIAIEGSVLYAAFLAHRAVSESLPAGRYRALTWALAATAAGMNFWHGDARGTDVGVALALTSLLSIVLLELTIALRKAQHGKATEGRDAAAIRRALVRRIRYPRLSIAAAALAAARPGLSADEAWRAAWVDRYGVGPEAPRCERRVAREVLRREERAATEAARRGALTIVNGQLVPAAWFGEPDAADERTGERTPDPADEPGPGERLDTSGLDDVVDTVVAIEVPEGLAAIERWMSAQAGAGSLRELPPARERDGEQPVSGPGERTGERSDERPMSDAGERSGERSAKGRSRRRSKKPRKVSGPVSGEHAERLETVRRLLRERPGMSGAQIQAETGIPESTARRLAAQVRNERSGTPTNPTTDSTDGSDQTGGERR